MVENNDYLTNVGKLAMCYYICCHYCFITPKLLLARPLKTHLFDLIRLLGIIEKSDSLTY
jgi:hypothetical protein